MTKTRTIVKALTFTLTTLGLYAACSTANVSDPLPGKPELVSSKKELQELADFGKGDYAYSVEDFFRQPKQGAFMLSPDGLNISFREKDESNKNHLYVRNIKTNKVQRVIGEGNDTIKGYGWANNNRLFYIKDNGGDENDRLFAVDIDGRNPKELTPYANVKTVILNSLDEQDDFMIILMNKDNPQVFDPYKINIKNGELQKLFENQDIENPVTEYFFSKDGELRAYSKQVNGVEDALFYKNDSGDSFDSVLQTSWKDTFSILEFAYDTSYPHDAYVLSNLESNTTEIVLYDLRKKQKIRTVYSNKIFDANSIGVSKKRNYELDFYQYYGEKPVFVPVSETFKTLHEKITKRFPHEGFHIVSKTKDEDRYIILINSDKLPGIYYLYNATEGSFTELYNLVPALKPDDMAEMRPIQFTSRDGLKIYGYLTIPKQAKDGNVPLIVNPHGGPYNVRDSWGFNPELQLFASRGYATLQVNFRGSGGYGKSFYLAGSKQIGRKMLEDLEDGVDYVKTLGLIDEKKIAIYGASYGGLATLGSLVKTPDLYRAGVDYVGISNLFTFFAAIPPYWEVYRQQTYEQWYDENSPEEQEIIKMVSPMLNVDKITKPVFVIQGANDPRVNINESDQIVENLRNRGFDVPYMVKYNEGHGFVREENRLELYRTMMGFFAKHLK